MKITNNCLSTISFTKDNISKIIKNLDSCKSHANYMISARTWKICGESILKSLEPIFKLYIESGKFCRGS